MRTIAVKPPKFSVGDLVQISNIFKHDGGKVGVVVELPDHYTKNVYELLIDGHIERWHSLNLYPAGQPWNWSNLRHIESDDSGYFYFNVED